MLSSTESVWVSLLLSSSDESVVIGDDGGGDDVVRFLCESVDTSLVLLMFVLRASERKKKTIVREL